jgi:hypothetical protein
MVPLLKIRDNRNCRVQMQFICLGFQLGLDLGEILKYYLITHQRQAQVSSQEGI